MRAASRVVVVGTLNVDQIWQVPALPRPGQTILASAVQRQFGGKGANQAVAAARQGARVSLVGAVGKDAEGKAYLEYLQGEGVDVARVTQESDIPTGTAHVYVDPAGENLIVVDPGANGCLDPESVRELLDGQTIVLLQLEAGLSTAVAVLRLAAACGARVMLNASPSQAGFSWGSVPIEALIVNEHECHDCFGHLPREIEMLPESARRELLQRRAVSHLIITQGAASTVYIHGPRAVRMPTLAVEPVDTVGAGDTFAGSLAAEIAAGRDWDAAIRYANVAAGLSTLTLGAQAAMPRRVEVEAALARMKAV